MAVAAQLWNCALIVRFELLDGVVSEFYLNRDAFEGILP